MNAITGAVAGFTEHRVPRAGHTIYARDYAGEGPTFVLLHGFPDNLRIYDLVAPLLAGGGARVISFDFLGYGASDKPADFAYSAKGWEEDLGAALEALSVRRPVIVAHDASGPTALNYALDHSDKVGALALMNVYYSAAPTLRFPQFISLFAEPEFRDLGLAMMQEPAIFGWLLTFQGAQFVKTVPEELAVLRDHLTPHVRDQFVSQPSVARAFLSVTADLCASVAANTEREAQLASLKMPVSLIWGAADPYLNLGVAEHLQGLIPGSELVRLPRSHWPQITGPQDVSEALLRLGARVRA